jgi:RimJ/RimL family protein N-acetyltransferase
MNHTNSAPHTVTLGGKTITLRPFVRADADALVAFAAKMPLHDLLFLSRDIREPRVVSAWLDQIAGGQITSTLALDETGAIVGCTALVRDEYSWSRHVGDVRLLLLPEGRGTGLGRVLAEHCIATARDLGLAKLTVRMTPDQGAALKVFEDMGFRPEALLRDHVQDSAGVTHDIAIMALDLMRHDATHAAYFTGGAGE